MTTTPDFRAELQRLVDLYEALGGNWSPHGYTDTWNDALASARAALATPPPEPPSEKEIELFIESIRMPWILEQISRATIPDHDFDVVIVRAALERWGR